MSNICDRLLRYSVGQRAFLSLRNGSVITGTIIGNFQNKVQIGFPLVVYNSSGTNVLTTNTIANTTNAVIGTPIPWLEVFCGEIIAASTGNIAVTASTSTTVTAVL
ncbi:hypothetical protein Dtox_1143 [Desulfofarcimen acetoxidans DSM 771]|uniref:Uncharacterized protein n=1 Tax=Desulfofarcimen acetoxidans (strain ATCC 49208 / DSM 771 / KCTC 5769 / VKM B-1644 / 5575) TaxID=485916 RepID=C8W4G1_DESAS|nr:hypothetical protein [Desulfofarcimen acetoxidans]ACV62029.1 hypothetical protein Dtox_1143 [Desulfofarcimen acetoxidans DSM 771]